jgi:hypothetical protein
MLKLIPFKFDHPDDTVKFLEEKFRENGLTHPKAYIFGDFGGIGSIILKQLKRKGWVNIRYCDNRRKSSQPNIYLNWNAQSWFNLGNLCKRGQIILLDDAILIKQLSSRMFKLRDGAIHQMVSKIEMRNKGLQSPDRGDATVLAFSDYQSDFEDIPEDADKPFEVEKEEIKIVGGFTLQSYARGSAGYVKTYNVNGGQKNFSEIQEQLNEYNQKRRLERAI